MNIAIIYRDRTKYANTIDPSDSKGREENPEIEAITTALSQLPCSIQVIDIGDEPHEKLQGVHCDLAFNLCDEGLRGSSTFEPHIPMIFDLLDIHYTGADYNCIATCNNKVRTKEILSYHKIKTPKFQVFKTGLEKKNTRLQFPLIVKPSKEDGSIGIRMDSVVHNEDALFKKIEEVLRTFKQPVIVEEYIEGRELTVGIVGTKSRIAMTPTETLFENFPEGMPKIYSYEAKWLADTPYYAGSKHVCPAAIQKTMETKLKRIALKVFELLNCSDYARVDFRVTPKGEVYILEVNPNPCLAPDGRLPIMSEAMGLGYDQLIYLIVKSAMERHGMKEADNISVHKKTQKKLIEVLQR